MPDKIEDKSISTFLELLSSKAPTPGGGSVAALSGSMAASLILMVSNLTVGKKKFQQHEAEIRTIIEQASELKQALINAVDEDIQVFNAVMACYRLSKVTELEISQRQEKLQAALKKAAEVPYHTAETCYRVLELNLMLSRIGNPNVISDVAVSTYLAEAALHSALCNVDINCDFITDEKFTSEYNRKRMDLASQATALKAEIISAVQTMISK